MWIDLGYLGLFLASFLAATILPFSSEFVLSGLLAAGGDPVLSLATATLGNWLGGLTSFWIGWIGKFEWIEKYLRIPRDKLETWHRKVAGKEWWISLFCWLPGVGDIIAVILGLLKSNFWVSAIGMFVGKALRYVVWGLITLEVIERL
ncbi:YqaA family protein [Marinilabilia salmonicolor]|uniref:YqaA family protein n=1 Tax=Marinilabilia salmonicolor TaxID=989 RepID=UPI00029AF270|nr:VTT domain-containing protein [Marinilabilia salmonicolor]